MKVPFWDITMASGMTLTPGADWDPLFDDTTLSERFRFTLSTSSGEVCLVHIGGSNGKRMRISWDEDNGRTIACHLSGLRQDDGGSGTIQVKLNGVITEYLMDIGGTSEYIFDLDAKRGRNQLVICTQYRPFTPTFRAILFDGRTSRWVDPRDCQDWNPK